LVAPGEGLGGSTHGVGWGRANYHPGKKAGDLTDAGDTAMMLLSHLAARKSKYKTYKFDDYAKYWKEQIDAGYGSCNFQTVPRGTSECPPNTKPGYLNGGARRTLQALSYNPNVKGRARKMVAADVNCLVAATHFLPLFAIISDEEALVKASVATVFLSHRNRDPIKAAEFLSRTLYRILYLDMPLVEALESAADATADSFISKKLSDAQNKVKESLDVASALSKEKLVDDVALTSMARLWEVGKSEPIKVGKASPTEGALPGALYLVIKYQHSLESALIANAGVGGDSAARGIVVGMLLGAVHGRSAIPQRWLSGLIALPAVDKMFDTVYNKVKLERDGKVEL
jgi:ADP-ribosylglycohydrolase